MNQGEAAAQKVGNMATLGNLWALAVSHTGENLHLSALMPNEPYPGKIDIISRHLTDAITKASGSYLDGVMGSLFLSN